MSEFQVTHSGWIALTRSSGMAQMRLFEQLKAKKKKGTATLVGSPRPARTE
jgi:hypothetical protein